MYKTAQKYGLIAGVVLSILIGIEFYLFTRRGYYSAGEVAGYLTMIIVMLTVYFSIRHAKSDSGKHPYSYTDGLKAGGLTTLFASGLFAIFSFILYRYLAPDFFEKYFRYQLEQIKNSGKSEAVIQQQLQQMQSMPEFFSSPVFQAFLMFLTTFVIGMIVTFISAAIMRDKKGT